MNEAEHRQRWIRSPHAPGDGANGIPGALMLEDGRPGFGGDERGHEKVEDPKQIDVDRTNAVVALVVGGEERPEHRLPPGWGGWGGGMGEDGSTTGGPSP